MYLDNRLYRVAGTVDCVAAVCDAQTNLDVIFRQIEAARLGHRVELDNLVVWRVKDVEAAPHFDSIHQKYCEANAIAGAIPPAPQQKVNELREKIRRNGCLIEPYNGISQKRMVADPEASKDGSGWLMMAAGIPIKDRQNARLLGVAQIMIPPDDQLSAKSFQQYPDECYQCPSGKKITELLKNSPANVYRIDDIAVKEEVRRQRVATALRRGTEEEVRRLNKSRRNALRAEYGAIVEVCGVGKTSKCGGQVEVVHRFPKGMTNIASAGFLTLEGSGEAMGWQVDRWVKVDVDKSVMDHVLVNWLLIGRLLREEA